jgi:hypothetical protein
MGLSKIVAYLRCMRHTRTSSAESRPDEVLQRLAECQRCNAWTCLAYAVVVVDVWRFLNLLVRRDEEIPRCDTIWVVHVNRDNGRHEIWPLEINHH